jgi:hypothetical protein
MVDQKNVKVEFAEIFFYKEYVVADSATIKDLKLLIAPDLPLNFDYSLLYRTYPVKDGTLIKSINLEVIIYIDF